MGGIALDLERPPAHGPHQQAAAGGTHLADRREILRDAVHQAVGLVHIGIDAVVVAAVLSGDFRPVQAGVVAAQGPAAGRGDGASDNA